MHHRLGSSTPRPQHSPPKPWATLPPLRAVAFLALTLIGGAGLGCNHSDNTATRTSIQAAYKQMDDGLHTKNLQTVLGCVAQDYAWTASNGHTYTRDQLESSLSDSFKTGDTTSTTQIIECKVSGETATVTAQTHQDTTFKDAVSGEPHKATVVSKSEDVWKHEGNTWKLHTSHELSHETLKDGKPYQAPKPPSEAAKAKDAKGTTPSASPSP